MFRSLRQVSKTFFRRGKSTNAATYTKEEVGCAGDTSINGLKISDVFSAVGPNTQKLIKEGSNTTNFPLGRWHTGTCADVLKKEVPGYDSK